MAKRGEKESNKGVKGYTSRDVKGHSSAKTPSEHRSAATGRYVTTSRESTHPATVYGYSGLVSRHSYDEKEVEQKPSLGERLLALRQKIVESGQPLLSWDEINEEAAQRRGKIE